MSKKSWIGIVVAAIIVVVVSVIFRAYLKTPVITQNQRSEMEVEKLNWGVYSRHPAKAKMEEAHILDELDVLVLYYGLLGKPYEASEFAHYFPEYQQSSNEFEKRKLAQSISTRLEKMNQNLLSSTLCVKVEDVRIGEYDFRRRGFPLQSKLFGIKLKEQMKSYAAFPDYSQSATLAFSIINIAGSRSGSTYSANSYVVFDNIEDNHIFPSFIPMSEDIAPKIVGEFGRGEHWVERQTAEALGQKYQGYRTAFAYVIFELKKAVSGTNYLEGIRFTTKEVHGNGIYVFLVTPKGTVLSVVVNSNTQPFVLHCHYPRRPRTDKWVKH